MLFIFLPQQANAGVEEKKISLSEMPVEVLEIIFRPLIHEAYPEQASDSALVSKFYNHIINSNIENLNFRMDGVDQKKLIAFRKYLSKLGSLKSLNFVVYAGGILRDAVPNLRNNQGQSYIHRENIALYLEEVLEVLVNIETFHFSLKHAHPHVSPIFLGLGMGLRGGGFVNLRVLQLNLESSNMDDEKVVIFASGLRRLPSLKDVDLNFSNNAIKTAGAAALGKGLGDCLGLMRLRLNVSQHGFGYAEVMALMGDPDVEEAPGIKSLVGLTSLDLDVTNASYRFTDPKIELQKILNKLPNLTNLRFAANAFIYKGLISDQIQEFACIALVGEPGVRNIDHLISLHLDLSSGGLNYDTECCVALAAGLQQMTRLTSLDLQLNYNRHFLNDDISMVPLADGIIGLNHLIHLNIDLLSCLDTNGAIALAGSLVGLKSLHILILKVRHADIEEAGMLALAEGIGSLISLKSLDLAFFPDIDLYENIEQMHASVETALVNAIGKLKRLTCFSFDFFFEPVFSGEGMQFFLKLLEELPHLRKVRVVIRYSTFFTPLEAEREHKFASLIRRLTSLNKVTSLDFIYQGAPDDGDNKNDLSDIIAIAIAGLLEELVHLTSVHITLPESKISDIGAIAIANALKTLENLKDMGVDLSESRITHEGAIEFYKLLKHPQWKYNCNLSSANVRE